MTSTNPSPNMNLPVPTVGTDPGPDWANNLNGCLTIIDQHDHTSGNGVPINPAGLNINADLPFNNNNLTAARSLRLQPQGSPISGALDLGCLYESGVDLYYNDGSGNQVRLTQSGAVAGTPGSIANLVSPASASYVSADQTFVWQADANTPANMDFGFIILRNNVVSSKGLTLSPPSAMGANYGLTLPSLPLATNIMTLDTAGNMGASLNVDNATIVISTNAIQIPANVSLPGDNVTIGGAQPIVQASNAQGAQSILRGVVSSSASGLIGEGFGATNPSTGIYTVTFNSAFSGAPAVVVGASEQGVGSGQSPLVVYVYGIDSTKFNVFVQTPAGAATNGGFSFLAMGPR